MNLREKAQLRDLLHGRFKQAEGFYFNIRLIGEGDIDKQGRITHEIEAFEHDGKDYVPCWKTSMRLYPSGLDDLEEPVLSGDGGTVLYRITANNSFNGIRVAKEYSYAQQGLDAHAGPSKPAAASPSVPNDRRSGSSSERGQPRAGDSPPPAACPHENIKHHKEGGNDGLGGTFEAGFYCKDCGERVG